MEHSDRFSQSITPLECTLQTIDDGINITVSVAPTACREFNSKDGSGGVLDSYRLGLQSLLGMGREYPSIAYSQPKTADLTTHNLGWDMWALIAVGVIFVVFWVWRLRKKANN